MCSPNRKDAWLMADETNTHPFERPIEVDRLRANTAFAFDEAPGEAEAEAIREAIGLRGLRKMRFQGEISPLGKRGWRVTGVLGASVTQECVVSLEPIKTRIETPVSLRFLPDSMIEHETPEDILEDDIEELTPIIDLGAIAVEMLLLALPEYPRIQTAEPLQVTAAPPGADPIKDEDTKAFAGLGALRDKLGTPPG